MLARALATVAINTSKFLSTSATDMARALKFALFVAVVAHSPGQVSAAMLLLAVGGYALHSVLLSGLDLQSNSSSAT